MYSATIVLLTWSVAPFTGVSTSATTHAGEQAFAQWSLAVPIEFQYREYSTVTPTDITISFQTGDHNDGWPFEGASNIAHAFGPNNPLPFRGQIHLNSEENWEANTPSIYSVLLHEIGHILGLSHTTCSQSIMQAHYAPWQYLYPYDYASIKGLWGLPLRRHTLPLSPITQ